MGADLHRVVVAELSVRVPEADAAMSGRIERLRTEQKERRGKFLTYNKEDDVALTEALDGWEASDKALEVQSRALVELQRDYESACKELAEKDEHIVELNIAIGRLQVGGQAELFAKYLDIILKQRDDARALADQLATVLVQLSVIDPAHHSKGHGNRSVSTIASDGIDIYEARSWK